MIFCSLLFGVSSCKKNSATPVIPPATVKTDSIVMSAGYANEVYYSMPNGIVQTSSHFTWDIAFRTAKRSSSILINDGAGVVLYTYPKADTSGWATLDTLGLHAWKPMYNDPNDWENGAFSRYAIGHPDYGWAIYNSVTHDLNGDSLFVIKLRDGSFKKLWMVKKLSSLDIYVFRYANINGSNEQIVTRDISTLTDIDFSGYSLETNAPVVMQPVKASWDILFTRYMSVQPDGTPYLVTGVLVNSSAKTKKFHPVALTYSDYTPGAWDSTRSSIGWNWKSFDMTNFVYKVVDSTVYFIKALNGDTYKFYFTAFGGSTTGVVKFKLQKVAGTALSCKTEQDLQLPSSLNSTGMTGNGLSFFLTDLTGRQLRADRPGMRKEGRCAFSAGGTGVQPGDYFKNVSNAAKETCSGIIATA